MIRSPNPTFAVNTAGTYEFVLEVWDVTGVKSCTPWVQQVAVVPDEAIYVELLWTTPNDPDETDVGPDVGSDMDLHFVHDLYAKNAKDQDKDGIPDPWFDTHFDCWAGNDDSNWGTFDPFVDDDPGLDLDDTDGAGPENLNLNIPENDMTYRIGVHYPNDHGYGRYGSDLYLGQYGQACGRGEVGQSRHVGRGHHSLAQRKCIMGHNSQWWIQDYVGLQPIVFLRPA